MTELDVPGQSSVDPDAPAGGALGTQAPGERYFRHPGDVIRLVLWAAATIVLALFVSIASDTSEGLTTDLGDAASRLAEAVRELALALAQVGAVLVPVAVVVILIVQRRWRRLGVGLLAAAAGLAVLALVDAAVGLSGRTAKALDDDTWVASTRFPSVWYLATVTAATVVGKAWLPRAWRRASDIALGVLAVVLALAGTAGVPDLLLALTAGLTAGSAVLVVLGAPNRRPTPAMVGDALAQAGIVVTDLTLLRAASGRALLYRAATAGGPDLFLKVYERDSRDADALYRGYRTVQLREPTEGPPSRSLAMEVGNEALVLLMGNRGGVACPEVATLATLADGSRVLAMAWVDGPTLDDLPPEAVDDDLLESVWRAVQTMHDARLAHRVLRGTNLMLDGGQPVITGLGSGVLPATPSQLAVDRAELLTWSAERVGAERALAAASKAVAPDDLAAAGAYLQPLALSAATRRPASKALLNELRTGLGDATGIEPPELAQLVRVRPRTLLMVVALTAAFYVLLPQLANVDDSVRAMKEANWGWLAACAVMSMLTYVASAVGMAGGVPGRLPAKANLYTQFASSFINRVTPANVGGMALNVRFMQKAGIPPAQAVTGVGLNSGAGAIVHIVLLFVFLAWAGKSGAHTFKVPASSKLLVIIAVVLAVIGIVLATRKGRRLMRTHVLRWLRQSWSSLTTLARSPIKLAELIGGSAGVTLAYIASLFAAVLAFDSDLSFAQVGAVYLGSSIIAAAAPTPGGLGAMEAALVAGLTGVGMDSGTAVAAVLSYRLLTYWLPILPGWLSFHSLERHNLI
jgi:undecaprenyl-diphosphatase